MITLCAWCEDEKPEEERDHRPDISHGICEHHLAQMRAEIAAKTTTPPGEAARRRRITMATEREQDGTGAALMSTRVSEEAFLLFDRQDDSAVIARIRGAALKEYVYAFKQAGQMIYGLGVDGAQACKRELARTGEVIEEDEIDIIREDVEYAYFRAKASRWAVSVTHERRIKLDTTVELKRQAKFTTRRDGTVDPNPFWLEQGGSKAMRNAILNLVPEEIKQKVIHAYKEQARIVEHTLASADAATEEYHAAFKDKDERDGLVAEIQGLWREMQATKGYVKRILVERGLSEALANDRADWSTVSLAAITNLRDEMKKAAVK